MARVFVLLLGVVLGGCCSTEEQVDPKGPKLPEPKTEAGAKPEPKGEVILNRMLEAGQPYEVCETGLTITNLGAEMHHAKDNHFLAAELEVELDGEKKRLKMWSGDPQVRKGFRIRLDYEGFGWGSKDVRVIVERLK